MFDSWRGFTQPTLAGDWRDKFTELARIARGDILKMTTVAASGHPGGSMSSLEIYLMLYNMANVDPKNPRDDNRDRIIVSHGHTSPGAYVGLASAGFFDIAPVLHSFRQGGSPFEGHVEVTVPGIEWNTGNLGQGLSVGLGKAIYGRLAGLDFHTYVLMGDGEQQKGQIVEARRQIAKFGLNRITAVIDFNQLQISGRIDDVMPVNIKAEWVADGWKVLEIDGHDLDQLYAAFHETNQNNDQPTLILARTVMGKGVSFMENDENFHGAPVKPDQIGKALKELGGIEDDTDMLREKRKTGPPPSFEHQPSDALKVLSGTPIYYQPGDKADNRGAFGKALVSVADANMNRDDFVMAVFDCDLSKSVKTDGIEKKYPDSFFQFGISEHSTAAAAGSLSTEKALSVWADFGVFGISETYNQARLNALNDSSLKIFCTHSGINAGEDGKTHHCIDYFGLLNSTFGWRLITPADPNQTDRVVRHVLSTPGNFAVVMGRSVVPIVTDEDGRPFFGEQYTYQYGRMETIRSGEQIALVAAGNILAKGLEAWNLLADDGLRVTLVSVSDWSDMHPEDISMLAEYKDVLVLEDHNIKTGLGTTIADAMLTAGLSTRLTKMGIADYAMSGKAEELYKLLGLDGPSIAQKVKSVLNRRRTIV